MWNNVRVFLLRTIGICEVYSSKKDFINPRSFILTRKKPGCKSQSPVSYVTFCRLWRLGLLGRSSVFHCLAVSLVKVRRRVGRPCRQGGLHAIGDHSPALDGSD